MSDRQLEGGRLSPRSRPPLPPASHSSIDWRGGEVKGSNLRLPEILFGPKPTTKRGFDPRIKAFWLMIAGQAKPEKDYIVEVNTCKAKEDIGVTQRTLENWLRWMIKHELVRVLDNRGGRGRGVIIDVIWVRKGEELAARRLRAEEAAKTDHIPPSGETPKLRHKSYISTPSVVGPGAEGGFAARTQPPADLILDPSRETQKRLWNLVAMRFRQEIEKHPLSARDQHIATAVLLSRVKGKALGWVRILYRKLVSFTGRFRHLKEFILWLATGRFYREDREKRERMAAKSQQAQKISRSSPHSQVDRREIICRVCGKPCVNGHVERMCWSCFYQKLYGGTLD